MNSDMWVGIAFCIFSLLCIIVSFLCRKGKLSYNFLIGIKTGSTLSSPEAWVAGHRKASTSLIVLAITFLLAGIYSLYSGESISNWFVFIFASIVVLCSIWSVISASKGAKEVIERNNGNVTNKMD